jgi:hypothetical protein
MPDAVWCSLALPRGRLMTGHMRGKIIIWDSVKASSEVLFEPSERLQEGIVMALAAYPDGSARVASLRNTSTAEFCVWDTDRRVLLHRTQSPEFFAQEALCVWDGKVTVATLTRTLP